METKELVTVGLVAAGAVALVALVSRKTTMGFSVDSGSATAVNAIANTNTAAINAQAQTATAFAQLATNYEITHDNNATQIALAQSRGATQAQLAQISADATTQTALLGRAAEITDTFTNAQRDVTIAGLNAQAENYKTQVGAQTADYIAGVSARTSIQQSNNALSAAQAQANASKTNSFWNFLGNVVSAPIKALSGGLLGAGSAPAVTSVTSNPVTVAGPNGPITGLATATYGG